MWGSVAAAPREEALAGGEGETWMEVRQGSGADAGATRRSGKQAAGVTGVLGG